MKKSGSQKKDNPLILIYSPKEKMRRILSAGLMQGNYRTIQAESLSTAGIKVDQYIPDCIILDIAHHNIKDLLFIERMQKSARTQDVAIVVSVTGDVRDTIARTQGASEEDTSGRDKNKTSNVRILEYPFHFIDLLKVIEAIILHRKIDKAEEPKDATEQNSALGDQLFDFQVKVQTKLLNIEKSVQHKWAFPFTVIKALDIISAESGGCRELGKCIESDPGAVSSIIRVANAVYYAKRDGRISEVTDAVIRIGFHETRNLLACMALIEMSPERYKQYGFSRREFWMHSLATAVIAEELGKNCGYKRPELAFVSGLVHDLGKIPLDNNFKQVFPRLLKETTDRASPYYEAEYYLMGFTHADLGHYLTSMWNFPNEISSAILNHHTPEKIVEMKRTGERMLQEIVYTANIFTKALSLGHSCDEVLGEIPRSMLKDLQIPRGPKRDFFNKILRCLKLFIDYLNLPKKDLLITKPCAAKRKYDFTVVYGEKTNFHPIVLALESRGYCVKVTRKITKEMEKQTKIALSIPDKGSPLDITFESDEEGRTGASPYLKVFLLEDIDTGKSTMDFKRDEIVLMDRHTMDIRVLLQAFDNYLKKVVVPEQEIVEDFFKSSLEE